MSTIVWAELKLSSRYELNAGGATDGDWTVEWGSWTDCDPEGTEHSERFTSRAEAEARAIDLLSGESRVRALQLSHRS